MAKTNPTSENLAVPSEEELVIADAPIARAPALTLKEIEAMGLDPSPYGYPIADPAVE